MIFTKAHYPDDESGVFPYNCWKQSDEGYNGTKYNKISRHVFLPSVEELSNLVDLNNANKVYNFLKGTNDSLNQMWLRDARGISPNRSMNLYYYHRSMHDDYTTDGPVGVRPAFVIDLSKVNATVVDTVKYK